MTQTKSADPFEGMDKSDSGVLKFGKVGDYFKGVLVTINNEMPNKLSAKGDMQRVFEFTTLVASFHAIEKKKVAESPTTPAVGELYAYFAKGMTKRKLEGAKLGQEVGLRFAEEKPNKDPSLNDTKVIEVYLGKMNEEWLKENPELPTE